MELSPLSSEIHSESDKSYEPNTLDSTYNILPDTCYCAGRFHALHYLATPHGLPEPSVPKYFHKNEFMSLSNLF